MTAVFGPQLPKRGDRFIHQSILAAGVEAEEVRTDPGNRALYAACVVTRVRRAPGDHVVYFTRIIDLTRYACDRSPDYCTGRLGEHVREWIGQPATAKKA